MRAPSIVRRCPGSHSAMSASEPTAIVPLRGCRPKMRAAFAEVRATNWSSEMRPAATPSEYSMGISVSRSATPCRAVTTLSAGSSLASSVQGAWSLHSVSNVAGGESRPERLTVGLFAQRRGPGVFCRVRLGEAFPGQVQVQRPGLDVDWQAGGPGPAAAVKRGGGRQVHDVDARTGAAGDADGLVDRSHLGGDRTGIREVRDRAAALRDQLLACLREHGAVLAVQQRHRGGRLRGAGRREQGGLVGREVRVGQKHLDARVPASGEGGDLAFWQRGGVQEDRVQEPVDRGLRRGAGHLPGDRGARRLLRAVVVRHRVGHVADRGDAAGDRGPGAGPEVVHPDREPDPVAKPLVREVGMRVDPAGNREQAVGGELLHARHRAAELGDPAAAYADVSGLPVTGRNHGRAAYNEVETHRSIVARWLPDRGDERVCTPAEARGGRPCRWSGASATGPGDGTCGPTGEAGDPEAPARQLLRRSRSIGAGPSERWPRSSPRPAGNLNADRRADLEGPRGRVARRFPGSAVPCGSRGHGRPSRLTASSSSFAATVAPSVRIVLATALARARVWGIRTVLSAADRDSVVGA